MNGDDAQTARNPEGDQLQELVDWLQGLRRLGWIELEIAEQAAHVGKYRRRYIAAVARCTEHGRQVVRLVGE